MEQLVKNGTLTESGKAAVIAACDPYHDLQIKSLEGWPDLQTSPSVVRCVKSSITTGPNVVAGVAGSIIIYTMPIMNLSPTASGIRSNNSFRNLIGGPSFNTVNIVKYNPADTDQYTVAKATNISGSYIDDAYMGSLNRVIGVGFEVHDVTAELYKQGTITAFEVPQSNILMPSVGTINPVTVGAATSELTAVGFTQVQKWPDSLDAAMYLDGTRQWEAKDGVYSVVSFQSSENPATLSTYSQLLINNSSNTFDTPLTTSYVPCYLGNVDAANPINGFPLGIGSTQWIPMDSKGVIISGLNVNSQFTITANIFMETFPEVYDPLVTLARPSCEYDPIALEIISRAMKNLPVAVPVAENGLGDWIADVVAEIGPWVEAAAGYLMPPLAPIAHAATALANNSIKKRKQTTKKAVVPAPVSQKTMPPNTWVDTSKPSSKQRQMSKKAKDKEVKRLRAKLNSMGYA